MAWNCLQHESAIVAVVEETAGLAWWAKLRERLEVALENVSEDLLWSETFKVLFFGDAWELADVRKNCRSVVKKGTRFDQISAFCLVGNHLELASDFIVIVGRCEHWWIKCRIYGPLDSKHYIENHIEVMVSKVNRIFGDCLVGLKFLLDTWIEW